MGYLNIDLFNKGPRSKLHFFNNRSKLESISKLENLIKSISSLHDPICDTCSIRLRESVHEYIGSQETFNRVTYECL